MTKPNFTSRQVLDALRSGLARDFTETDWLAFSGASEGSCMIDGFDGWLVVVGSDFRIEAFNNEGEGYMLVDGEWNEF